MAWHFPLVSLALLLTLAVSDVRGDAESCSGAPVGGRCRAHKQRWYYDPADNQCKSFVYGGCGGNGNNYRTQAQCEARCAYYHYGESEAEESCSGGPAQGYCRAYFPSWYYDPADNQCKPFIYGGCGGNGNKYRTQGQCEARCYHDSKRDARPSLYNILRKKAAENKQQRDIPFKRTSERHCRYGETNYRPSDKFPASDGCNTCTCTAKYEVICTGSICVPEINQIPSKRDFPPKPLEKRIPVSSGCVYKGREFSVGESYMVECNKCTCGSGGSMCTMMACPPDSESSESSEENDSDEGCTYNGQNYASGDSFRDADDCNNCFCSNGAVSCTEMACMEIPEASGCAYKGQNYSEGEDFMDDCNKCGCTGGNVVCTQMACEPKAETLPAKRSDDGSCVYNGKTYADGDDFSPTDGCNLCFCINGNVGCSRMECALEGCVYKGKTYNDGEEFMDDCNTCGCGGGHVLCSTKSCPPKPQQLPAKRSPRCVHNGKTYSPGDSFEDGCNMCLCMPNDQVACTSVGCGLPSKRASAECFYNNQNYPSGAEFPSTDGCNDCFCAGNGAVGCTLKSCPAEAVQLPAK